jgi:hypothetical protein
MLFTKCGKNGGECTHKELVDDACEGYGFVLSMEEYGDAMFPFTRYCFMVVTL